MRYPQGDASNTYTVPVGRTAIVQGISASGGASRTELGARIDVLAAHLIIRHMTITGQHAISQPNYLNGHKAGAAIFVYEGLIDVQHTAFVNNDADDEGGAIMAYFATQISITDSQFTFNHVNDVAGGDLRNGGAIYMDLTEDAQIERCAFNQNTADSGGAIYIETGNLFRELVLSDCSGVGNWATDGCGGNTGAAGTGNTDGFNGETGDCPTGNCPTGSQTSCSGFVGKACEDAAGCGWDGAACMAAGANGEVDHSCYEHGCVVYWTGSQSRCLHEPEMALGLTIDGRDDYWAYISLGDSIVGPGGDEVREIIIFNTKFIICNTEVIILNAKSHHFEFKIIILHWHCLCICVALLFGPFDKRY